MSIILFLIIGLIVGWLAAAFTGRQEGVIGSMAIGVVGSIIGGFLSVLITGSNKSYLALSWSGFFWSFIGALILAALLNALQHSSHRHI